MAGGRLFVDRLRRPVTLTKASARVRAGGRKTLKLKLRGDPKDEEAVALIRSGAYAYAKLKLKLTDGAGNVKIFSRRPIVE